MKTGNVDHGSNAKKRIIKGFFSSITKGNTIMKTKIYSKILKNGLKVPNIDNINFKNETNQYLRNSKNLIKIKKHFPNYKELKLTFDDRLNLFFLFDEYNPVIGFYEYRNTIQIVPFYNKFIDQAIATIIDYQEVLNNLKTKPTQKDYQEKL